MPTLLLSSNSYIIHQLLPSLVGKPMTEVKLVHIITAGRAPDIEDTKYLELARKNLTELGLDYSEIDIKGMDEERLHKELAGSDVVYVNGGNTYYLLKAVRQSGFDKVIKELLDQGTLYVGASAGACLMTPSIETTDWRPEDRKIPDYDLESLAGLNYVPFMIKPHWDKAGKEEKKIILKRIKESNHPLRLLKDNQAFLVRDGKVKLVGKGREVRLD